MKNIIQLQQVKSGFLDPPAGIPINLHVPDEAGTDPQISQEEISLVHCPLSMPCYSYKLKISKLVNEPLTLQTILRPFGIQSCPRSEDPDILTGIYLDAINASFTDSDTVGPEELMILAADLGFGPAEDFLDAVTPSR